MCCPDGDHSERSGVTSLNMTENNRLTELVLKEVTRFSEWRGAVKEALKHLADSLARCEKEADALWDAVKGVQHDQKICRERCSNVSCTKADKADLKECEDDVENLKTQQSNQEKLQIKQQATLAFYGVIGGGLFTLALALFNHFLRSKGINT